ncbi:MAG: hybrid sensor histidine kinase/response regulator [Polyangiaceae bacterium]|nr:hybrid sensor histidine kinase/response regulator [Polyangiaceae bacterium]
MRSRDPHSDLAGVLHDVSNTLTVLLGWVGEARAPGASGEAVARALGVIEQRARIARDLVRHAIGAPHVDGARALGAVIEEVTNALSVEAARKGTRLIVAGEAAAMVDGALDLAQILTNLILNAIAHAPRDTVIEIKTALEDERCAIVVSDEGQGVSPERRHSIFLGDSSRPGGAGIGLRHSRALARSYRGDVDLVVEDGARKGAAFRVFWPRADVVPESIASAPRGRDLDGLRVLLLEDDVAVTRLLDAALEARGASVAIASTAEELSASLANAVYDAVLVDLSPIAENPDRALANVRARLPHAKILLITGNADAVPSAFADHDVELVRKPFEVGEVIRALRVGCAKPS